MSYKMLIMTIGFSQHWTIYAFGWARSSRQPGTSVLEVDKLLTENRSLILPQWTIPNLPEQHVDTPVVVHYPHFSTSDVHFGLIDW